MPHDSGSHLTVSRISRLLRPLRTKCKHFAASANAAKPRGGVTITYTSSSSHTSRRSSYESDIPPLAVVLPPVKLSSLSGSGRPTRDDIVLSKGIYDVRDAFRNILQAAYGASYSFHDSDQLSAARESRVRSLASICASVVGDHIEDQAQLHSEEDEAENEDEMDILSDLYEAIPPHFRRYTVVAHALSLIMGTCPRHPSLLHLLLEVGLSYNLGPESRTLLRHLLDLAFRPQSASFSPRVTHPAHSNYLTTLFDMCVKRTDGGNTVIGDRAFTRVVVDILGTAPDPLLLDAWTCKAVSRLARRVLPRDFTAYALFPVSLLVQMSARRRGTSNAHGTSFYDTGAYDDRLTERLTKWLDGACRHEYNRQAALVSDSCNLGVLVDLLTQASNVELSPLHIDSDINPADLLVCLSTLVLNASTFHLVSERDQSLIIDFLRRTRPDTRTFATLIILSLSSTPMVDDSAHPFSDVSYWSACTTIDLWAKSLKDKGCFLHEASLWSAFLSQLDSLLPEAGTKQTSASSARSFDELRSKIIISLEEAERRTFGGPTDAPQEMPTYTPRKGSNNPKAAEWRWEEMFDCWVAKTPATTKATASRLKRARSIEYTCAPVKRRRIHEPRAKCPPPVQPRRAVDDSSLKGGRSYRATSSHSSRTSTSLSPSPSPSYRSKSVVDLQFPSDDEGNEDIMATSSITRYGRGKMQSAGATNSGPLDRRKTLSFQTVVADALKKRVVLHPKRRHTESQITCVPVLEEKHLNGDVDDIEEFDSGICTVDQLSSDDALNLFSYMSSEC